jgi:hypothetical protein
MKFFGSLGGVSFDGLLDWFSVDELDAVSDGWEEVWGVTFAPPGLGSVEEFVGHCHACRSRPSTFRDACSEAHGRKG